MCMLHIDIMDEDDRETSPEIPFQGTSTTGTSSKVWVDHGFNSWIATYVTINCRGKGGERLVRRERKVLR